MTQDNTDCAWCGKPTTTKRAFTESVSGNKPLDLINFHAYCFHEYEATYPISKWQDNCIAKENT